MMQVKQISDNEIYLLITFIKSVLWRVVKRLSYIEDARCLKVKPLYDYIQAVQTRKSQNYNCKSQFTGDIQISLSVVILDT